MTAWLGPDAAVPDFIDFIVSALIFQPWFLVAIRMNDLDQDSRALWGYWSTGTRRQLGGSMASSLMETSLHALV